MNPKSPVDLPLALTPRYIWESVMLYDMIDIFNSIHILAGEYYNDPSTDVPAVPFSAAGPGAVGNGTLTYTYRIRNGMVSLFFQLAIGATTNLGGGVGPIGFQIPTGFPSLPIVCSGTAVVYCAAAAPQLTTGIAWMNGGLIIIDLPFFGGPITPVFPAAFAAGDSISFNIDYPYI